MNWNPVAVWNEVKLKQNEIDAIHLRMSGQPKDSTGKYPADGVFEGGGVWGTAFLGAVRCCEDVGVSWVGLAGTSAGAITAGLLAAGYSAAELESVFADLSYMDFLRQPAYRPLFDSDPSDDLEDGKEAVALLGALMLHHKLGRYKSDAFHDWYAQQARCEECCNIWKRFQVRRDRDDERRPNPKPAAATSSGYDRSDQRTVANSSGCLCRSQSTAA